MQFTILTICVFTENYNILILSNPRWTGIIQEFESINWCYRQKSLKKKNSNYLPYMMMNSNYLKKNTYSKVYNLEILFLNRFGSC